MKKFFEKYDLIKVSGIMVILSAILTWVIPSSSMQYGELVNSGIQRIGLTNFLQYGLLGIYYFSVLVTFLFVMGGFYQVLSKRAGYQKLIKSISEKLKGCEIPFVLIVSLLFAIASSLMTEYFPLLAFIPFVIAILNRLKVDKISSFVATFGGLLVGQIGSTFSTKTAGQLTNTFELVNESILIPQTIIFVVAFIFLAVFTILRMHKLKDDRKFEEYDKFNLETTSSSKQAPEAWPYAIGIILLVFITIIAYLPWSTWEVTLFTDITTWFNELSLADVPIMSYIFGEIIEFGEWDIFTIQFVMLIITALIHWFGKVSLDEIFESYGEGFKKVGPTIVVLLMVYLILEYALVFPVIPTIVEWLANLTEGFSTALTFIGSLIASAFGVEMYYVMSLAGTYYASIYTEAQAALAIIFQSAFGFVSFFVPSSAILMVGLSYLNIPYKDWMKFIWKFLVVMLIAIVIILLIVA